MEKKQRASRAKTWTYQLRLLGINPKTIPMDRLGEYMTEFANLLGAENLPKFNGIKKASTGLLAILPETRTHHAHLRLVESRNDPKSKPGRHLANIQKMIDADDYGDAQLIDRGDNVVYLFKFQPMKAATHPTIHQSGTVDGVVTGMVGADDTMHLHLRDWADRDLKVIVTDETLARALLQNFRIGSVRVYIEGHWKRTDLGWAPENNRCTARSFEKLNDTPVSEVLAKFSAIPGNGWKEMKNPMGFLDELRGATE